MKDLIGKNRKKKRGRSKNKEFMDAALDAFIRDQALKKWHEVDGLSTGAELVVQEAIESSSEFFEKDSYKDIWRRWWRQEVVETEEETQIFAMIEIAVKGAVLEERETRKRKHDVKLEDTVEYKEFVSRQMGNLLFEAHGDIEDEI